MTDKSAPIDPVWLMSATAHDTERTKLVLATFVAETERDLDKLLLATNREHWQDAAHALKSSASAVGATALIRLADEAQYLPEAAWKARRETFEAELKSLVASATSHACQLMV